MNKILKIFSILSVCLSLGMSSPVFLNAAGPSDQEQQSYLSKSFSKVKSLCDRSVNRSREFYRSHKKIIKPVMHIAALSAAFLALHKIENLVSKSDYFKKPEGHQNLKGKIIKFLISFGNSEMMSGLSYWLRYMGFLSDYVNLTRVVTV